MEQEAEEKKKVLAKTIIEILGAPKEHVEKTLNDYVEKLKKDKDLEIVKSEFEPPKQQKKLFSAFVELDIRFKTPQKLIDFCVDSMPSSVEIIEPDEIIFSSQKLASTINDLQARLHDNDMIVKTLKARNTILDKNAKSILRNFVNSLVEEKHQKIEYLSSKMGIKQEQLKPFLDELIKEGKLVEKEDGYGKPD